MAFGLFMLLPECGVYQDGDRNLSYLLQIVLKRNITHTLKVLAPLPSPFFLSVP